MTKITDSGHRRLFSGAKRFVFAITLAVLVAGCQVTAPQHADNSASLDQLLTLIDQRLEVAPLVARSKWNSGAPIDDPVREKLILDAVTAQAAQAGIDERFARVFFQNQFDAGKLIQRKLQEQWRSAHQAPFSNAPDLGRDIRPMLDRLTPEIIVALRAVYPSLYENDMDKLIDSEGRKLIQGEIIDEATRNLALQALTSH